jgi:hypothetical protein
VKKYVEKLPRNSALSLLLLKTTRGILKVASGLLKFMEVPYTLMNTASVEQRIIDILYVIQSDLLEATTKR